MQNLADLKFSATTSATSLVPIPTDLRSTLPYPETPWRISSKLLEKANLTSAASENLHCKVEVIKDEYPKEYEFVTNFFNHQNPPGMKISSIWVNGK